MRASRASSSRPPGTVVERFGLRGDPHPLTGGEGRSFRLGDVVVKRAHDADETEWIQALSSRIQPQGFRLAPPVPTLDGGWVHEGWSATRWIDGLEPAAPEWAVIADAGLRFSDAAERAGAGARTVLAHRSHRWAVADRVAWAEEAVVLPREAARVREHLTSLLGPVDPDGHLVHGDLSGNVFFDRAHVPVVLDVSPYVRPRRWGSAIVIADAVLWYGAAPSLAVSFAAADPADRDLLGRALIFRLVSEQLAPDPRHGAMLEPYERILTALS